MTLEIDKPISKLHIYAVQILFAISISIGSNSLSIDDAHKCLSIVARYIVYLYLIRGSGAAVALSHDAFRTKQPLDLPKLYKAYHKDWLIFGGAIATLLYSQQRVFGGEFLLVFVAKLITEYPEMEKQTTKISYGTGMACSFFEGYLTHVIPSDGYRFVGFAENIRVYEQNESVIFPVKRLFIVVTKSLYCPPDLKLFNKEKPGLPYLEACKSLEDVMKDVAGVRNRIYRNSAYKIHRPNKPPVYLAVECATPIHTLHLVLKNRKLYEELDGINEAEVVHDFTTMLRSIISKSPECQNKCEIVYYDDTDPNQNLSDVLLDKIREIEPNFEDMIRRD
ncbi:hypothetical protein ABMA28_004900 [Loxostege sticticalis]|uniref:STING ligand-binding domain-containing protein n=1 Tax=Loxostege sticticalis TaxID=481309 RepID=A0ABD0SNK8_LOXSC